jgi:hypothetical protein
MINDNQNTCRLLTSCVSCEITLFRLSPTCDLGQLVFLSAPERTMRASSQRREAADDPLMALVNVVREPRGDDQRSRTGQRLVFSVLH